LTRTFHEQLKNVTVKQNQPKDVTWAFCCKWLWTHHQCRAAAN